MRFLIAAFTALTPIAALGQTYPSPTFSNVTVNSGITAATGTFTGAVNRTGAAGTQRVINLQTNNANRWQVNLFADAESGNNAGSSLLFGSWSDTGAPISNPLWLYRASGPRGNGAAWIGQGATTFGTSRETTPNGVFGNLYQFTNNPATQTLGADPIATTSGSANVVLTWTGHGMDTTTFVNIGGATAVGGLTLSGWYAITATTTNTVTINAGSTAGATTTGGGSIVTIQPSFTGNGQHYDYTSTTGAGGFDSGVTEYMTWNPNFFAPAGFVAEGHYEMFISPNDSSHNWTLAGYEINITNRGADLGWAHDYTARLRQTAGMTMVATAGTPGAPIVGNQGTNNLIGFNVAPESTLDTNGMLPAWYQGYSVQPHGLVGTTRDPAAHGGVAYVASGAYLDVSLGVSTTSGSSTVTVSGGNKHQQTGAGATFNFVAPVVIGGLTLTGPYTVATTPSATSFTFTAGGSASSSVANGGTGAVVMIDNMRPYSPMVADGGWSHGLDLSGMNTTDQTSAILQGGCKILTGAGAPAVAAPVCSLYLRTDGGAGTTLYVKESGTGTTGWVGK